jgi:hypothetical protein
MKSTILVIGFAACAAAAQAGEVSGELSRKPWSGTFWPLKTAKLAFGNWGQGLAPFEKYDNYVSLTTGTNPGATAREADPANGHNEAPDPKAENWTGHCHGWAPASLMEPEPPVEVTVKLDQKVSFLKLKVTDAAAAKSGMGRERGNYGVRPGGTDDALEFATADLKGMLTEIYCETKSSFYGTRYNGKERDRNNGAYMDVKPHLMHQLLVKFIKDKDQGLVFDVDPTYMVWNQPIYKFDSQWTENGEQLEVTTTIHWANDNGVDANYVGTESVARTYTYTMKKDAQGNIVDSAWTGKSLDDHPDFIWQPYGVINQASAPGLDLDVVHEIIANNGKTVTVKNTGPTGDETEGSNGGGTEENRRNLWERMRDGVRRIFGRG